MMTIIKEALLNKAELKTLKSNSFRYSTKQWQWALGFFSLEAIRKVVVEDGWSDDGDSFRLTEVPSKKLHPAQCGIGYISPFADFAFGGFERGWKVRFKKDLDVVMLRHWCSNRKYVMTTLNDEQEPIATEMIKYGFEVIKDWTTNPNTGREIIILMYAFPSDSDLKKEK